MPPTKGIHTVGVDRGGTWIRVVGLDALGRRVVYFKKPSVPLEELPAFLRSLFRRWKSAPQNLAVASRGVWLPAKRKALAKRLRSLAPQIQVLSDVEAAWQSVGRGIVLIGGTGSIALTKTLGGSWKRAGGLGPDKGDEGSGYWIAKQWGSLSSPFEKGGSVATVVLNVIKKAKRRNPDAQRVIHEAYGHLAALLWKLDPKGRTPAYLHGGLFEIPFFRRGFTRFARAAGWRGDWLKARHDAATAAARDIMRVYGSPP